MAKKAKAITLEDGTILAGNEDMWILLYRYAVEASLEGFGPSGKKFEKEVEQLGHFIAESFAESPSAIVTKIASSAANEKAAEKKARREYYDKPLSYSIRGIVKEAMRAS